LRERNPALDSEDPAHQDAGTNQYAYAMEWSTQFERQLDR